MIARRSRIPALLVLALLVTATAPSRAAADPTLIRIGVSDTDAAAQPLYAQETGVFRRDGLDARITRGMQGARVLDAIAAGTIDVGFANIVSIATAIQRGAPVVLLAPGPLHLTQAPLTVIVQAPSSHFRSGADLNGKRVEVPSGRHDLATISTAAWIDEHGGDSRTVHFVSGIPLAKIAGALAAGRIDASELTEPYLSLEKRKGAVKVFGSTYDAIAPRFYIGGYAASKTWVESHPEAARRFVSAMREIAHWANAHPSQTAPMLAAWLGVSPSVVASMTRARFGETLSLALIQPALDVAAKYGAMEPMHAADVVASRPER
jgi:NitT/TauT family transport system substrate-binding protein